jgi:anti-anti-sigma factor
MKMTVTRAKHESGAVIFSVVGNLHGTAEGYAFQDEVRNQFSAGTRKVIIDLNEVGRIDSCGIGILAAVAMSAQNAGSGLVLSSLPDRIVQVLGVTNFLEFVESADSVPEAVSKLAEMSLP